MTGTTIAQIIPIAVSPILTRLYSPEQFGIFALYVSITTILSSLATGRYELAILLPRNNSQAINIVALSILCSLFTGFLTLIIVFLFNTQITQLLNTPKLSSWLYLMAATVLFTGTYQSMSYWLNRGKKYVQISFSKIIQTGTTSLFNVGIGFLELGVSGLILGTFIGLSLAVGILINAAVKHNKKIFSQIKIKKIYILAKRYSDFLKYSTISALFNNLSNIGLPIVISLFFDNAIVGLYYFAIRIIKLPLKLIFNSLSQVYFEKAAQLYLTNKAELNVFTNKVQKKIILIVIPFLIISSLIAPYAFKIIFGDEWEPAGRYVKYFAIFIFCNSIYAPISSLGSILNKQKTLLYFNIFLVLSQILIMYISSQFLNFEYTLLIISFLGGFQYLLLHFHMKNTLLQRIKKDRIVPHKEKK